MLRKILAAGIFALLVFEVAAYPSLAAASTSIITPQGESAFWTTQQMGDFALASGQYATSVDVGYSAPAQQMIADAQVILGAEPELTLLGTLPLAAGGLLLGITIGNQLNNYFHLSCKISGDCGDTSTRVSGTVSVVPISWTWRTAAQIAASTYLKNVSACSNGCWVLNTQVNGGSTSYQWAFNDQTLSDSYCTATSNIGSGACYQSGASTWVTVIYAPTLPTTTSALEPKPSSDPGWTQVTHDTPTPSDPGWGSSIANAIAAALGAGVFGDDGHTQGGSWTPVTNPTQDQKDGATNIGQQLDPSWAPPSTTISVPDCTGMTQADCQDALYSAGLSGSIVTLGLGQADITKPAGAVVSTDPAAGATVDTGSTVQVNVNPDPMPIQLLQPLPNETYSDYLTRLQNAGYVGTVTETDESAVVDGYGASAPVRVLYPDPTTLKTVVLDPTQWPSPLPLIAPDAALTVYVNPATATPVPETNPGTCDTCAIDWTPLENLNLGSKFPFGFVTWIESFFTNVPKSGTCPILKIGKPAQLGGGEQDISFCNATWESWQPTVFNVLEILMTVAGVSFLAIKILGYGGGSD